MAGLGDYSKKPKGSRGYKMKGLSGFKQRTEGPVKPKSMMAAEEEEKKKEESGSVTLIPGFEDPIKIQELQRRGLVPGSQKFGERKK